VFSLFYGLAVVIIAWFYRLHPARINCKVISVGNITLGGTGKTVLVEYLVERIIREGNKPAVLSRGYKRDARLSGEQSMGDEPAMLRRKFPHLPVIVDKDRLRGASKAIKDYAVNTLILDDGMQQWRIFKDLEIITIDSRNPFGNFRLLPAGFLREPLSSLKRADIFVLTKVDAGQDTAGITDRLRKLNPRALIVESRHFPESLTNLSKPDETLSTDSVKGKSVLVFSGIGNPQSFEDTIHSLGASISEALRFFDHYDYRQADLDNIIRLAKEKNIGTIITTGKDAVKISRLKLNYQGIFSLNIKLKLTKNEAEFDRRLFKLYSF